MDVRPEILPWAPPLCPALVAHLRARPPNPPPGWGRVPGGRNHWLEVSLALSRPGLKGNPWSLGDSWALEEVSSVGPLPQSGGCEPTPQAGHQGEPGPGGLVPRQAPGAKA